MELNTCAGRTYQDLGQYPVFPWIIADYESAAPLDLRSARTYRDLAWPCSAQTERRRATFRERYAMAEEIWAASHGGGGGDAGPGGEDARVLTGPPSHTGCHYSNPAAVLWRVHCLCRRP